MKPAPIMTPEQHERHHLRFRCATEGERFTVTVAGKINAANARPIRNRCMDAVVDGATTIALDVSACDEIDKRGFGELISLRNAARRLGVALVIVGASAELKAQFDRWVLTGYFKFRESSNAVLPPSRPTDHLSEQP